MIAAATSILHRLSGPLYPLVDWPMNTGLNGGYALCSGNGISFGLLGAYWQHTCHHSGGDQPRVCGCGDLAGAGMLPPFRGATTRPIHLRMDSTPSGPIGPALALATWRPADVWPANLSAAIRAQPACRRSRRRLRDPRSGVWPSRRRCANGLHSGPQW